MTIVEVTRRTEILETAASVFESSGIRASLKDIADAAGIQAGSLYHHFESKEAIVVELVQQYLADLDRIADEARSRADSDDGSPLNVIYEFGAAIAASAVRHRAAVLLTFYEPPSVFRDQLAQVASRTPVAILTTMSSLLERAHARGALREGIDLGVLADWLCQSMLHVGIGVFHRNRAAKPIPVLKCRMLLEGLADEAPDDDELDRSPARRVADDVIASWPARDENTDGRSALVYAAARSEFGRRGYEATTMRDVAAAAELSPRTVYRVAASKEQLLLAILEGFVESGSAGWNAVVRAKSTPLEKLDALLWLDIMLLDRFREEHRIQSVSLQFAPPTSQDLGLSFPAQLRQTRNLLTQARRAKVLRFAEPTPDVLARSVFSLIWTPASIIGRLGPSETLRFDRETLLRGAAVRGPR